MTYRTKFFLFLVFIHLVEVALAIIVLYKNDLWFIAAEALIVISLSFSVYFFVAFSKPLKLINSGIESIQDKDFSMRLVKVGQPELDSLIEVYNHMIDKLRHERTLQQEQHYFLEKLLQASPSGILILDPDGKIKMMNPAAEAFTGINFNHVKNIQLKALENVALVKELLKIGANQTQTVTVSGLLKYKVHSSYFINQGFRNQFLVIEELSNEVYKIERSAYEKVIRTISHEFNNSIGPINSVLGSLKTHIMKSEPDQQPDFENAIEVAIQRNYSLNDFIRRYAQLFKLPPPILEKCNINELVLRLEKIFHHEMRQNCIKFTLLLSPDPLIWQADINQFELVISNILKNAIEATGKGGEISICTSIHPDSLSIYNTGEPIPAEIQKQLFTPFFTTKKTGQGIGLTLVREILQNHRLRFSLESSNEGRTCFWIGAEP